MEGFLLLLISATFSNQIRLASNTIHSPGRLRWIYKRPSKNDSNVPSAGTQKSTSESQGISDVNLENSTYEETLSTHMQTDSHVITKFMDEEPVKTVRNGDKVDPSRVAIQGNDVGLDEFFSRPIKITSFQWTLAGTLNQMFDPWNLYFSNLNVARKLTNYDYISAKLHVKIVLNGTPFHYGHLVFSYLPLDVECGTHEPQGMASLKRQKRKMSTLMNVELDPVNNKSGVICCPFMYPWDMMEISELLTPTNEYQSLGNITMASYTTLGAASATPVANLSISVFAWATDVVLAGPSAVVYSATEKGNSLSYAKLSGTPDSEYTSGVLSKPLGLISKGTGVMSKVPIIGNFMNTASKVAGVAADLASFFGFSKPPQLEPANFMKRLPMANTAVVRGTETVLKTTFDPKQAVNMSPTIANIDDHDELILSRFLTKSAYVDQFTWSVADAVDSVVCYGRNQPIDFDFQTDGFGNGTILPTPLSLGCLPFTYWSGSIVYRIKVVASAYHSGRLRFTFTPNLSLGVVVGEYNTQYSAIIDLADNTDVFITVPWMNNASYLNIDTTNYINDSVGTLVKTGIPGFSNGVWTLSVMNELVSPYNLADVEVLIYKCGGPDFEVFNPRDGVTSSHDGFPTISSLSPRASVAASALDATNTLTLFGKVATDTEIANRQADYSGEATLSFRELLKRYSYSHTYSRAVGSNSETAYTFRILLPFQPTYIGAGGAGDSFNVTAAPASTPFNFSRNTLMGLLATCFVGHRGSIRSKYVPTTRGVEINQLTFARQGVLTGALNSDPGLLSVPVQGASASARTFSDTAGGWTGAVVTDGHEQRCLEVDVPFYSRQRFYTNGPTDWGARTYRASANGLGAMDTLSGIVTSLDNTTNDRQVSFDRWVASGEDFNFLYNLGPSELTYYPSANYPLA